MVHNFTTSQGGKLYIICVGTTQQSIDCFCGCFNFPLFQTKDYFEFKSNWKQKVSRNWTGISKYLEMQNMNHFKPFKYFSFKIHLLGQVLLLIPLEKILESSSNFGLNSAIFFESQAGKFLQNQAEPSWDLLRKFRRKILFCHPLPPSSCFGGFGRSFFKFGQSSEGSIKSSLTNRGIILTNSQPKNSETCLVLILWYNAIQCNGSHSQFSIIQFDCIAPRVEKYKRKTNHSFNCFCHDGRGGKSQKCFWQPEDRA